MAHGLKAILVMLFDFFFNAFFELLLIRDGGSYSVFDLKLLTQSPLQSPIYRIYEKYSLCITFRSAV